MKFDDFQALTPFQKSVILLLEEILKILKGELE